MLRLTRYDLSKRLLLLVATELPWLIAALPVAAWWRGDAPPSTVAWVAFVLVHAGFMAGFGLYRRDFDEGLASALVRAAFAFGLGFTVLWAAGYLVPRLRGPTLTLALASALAFALVAATRAAFFRWLDWDLLKTRVLVLGTGTRAARVAALLNGNETRRRLALVGFLPLSGVHHFVERKLILTDPAPLPEIADRYRVDEIVIAVRERRGGGLPVDALLECKLKGIAVSELSTFLERERGAVQLDSLNTSWMLLSDGFRRGFVRDAVKRLFDLAASSALLVVSLPLMLLAALAIWAESGRPVLYRQERVGEGGRVFTLYKFRSMHQNAEADGQPRWAQTGDSRVTRVGRFLRKTRIDELPQLINVFKGEMSFVGPRPERPFFVDQLLEQIPYYNIRHALKPGITGWAQVRYAYGACLEDAMEKLQYDLYYVKNHSLFLDLVILFETMLVVLFGKGAR